MKINIEDLIPSYKDLAAKGKTRLGRSLTHDHPGIDIPLPVGTKLTSPFEGKVTSVTPNSAYAGNWVSIYYPSLSVTFRFLHLSRISVKNGSSVAKGQTIGLSGNTGESTGPHLHLEIIKGNNTYLAYSKNKSSFHNPNDWLAVNAGPSIKAKTPLPEDPKSGDRLINLI